MAVFGFLFGSILGLVGALAGWLIWDIPAWVAMVIYLGSGLGFGTLVSVNCCLRHDRKTKGRNIFV